MSASGQALSPRVCRKAHIGVPAVSVVIPVHNAGPYVAEALDSVLAQRDIAFETVAVDDASTDDSLETLLSIDDSRLSVLALPERMGVAAARNAAMPYVRAPWLCAFDADDVMLPDSLAPYIREVTARPGSFWAYCGVALVDARGAALDLAMRNPFDLLKLLQRNIIPHPMSLVRRDIFDAAGGYNPQLPSSVDYDLWLRLIEWGDPFFHDRTCVHYRRHGAGLSDGSRTSDTARALLRARLAQRHDDPARESRRETLRTALAFLDSSARRDWREVFRTGAILLERGLGGFELDVHMSRALAAQNRLREALDVALGWVGRLARGERVLPYEAGWALTQSLALSIRAASRPGVAALLPVAQQLAPALGDTHLALLVAQAARMLEPGPDNVANIECIREKSA